MDDLTTLNDNLTAQEKEASEVFYGKVLGIEPSTPNIDFKGILNQVFQYINIADVLDKVKRGAEYVVQIPSEFQGGFDAGDYWIMENSKTGKLWPSLMELGEDGRNHIVTPLSVKKKAFIKGNPTKDITNSYQNIYLQQQMNELSGLIETTLDTVKRIEHGQMDDRIALLEAGKQGVILALSQKNEASRASAMLLAINNINVAQNQIAETFKRRVTEFEALPKSAIGQFFRELIKTGYLDEKDNEYNEIQEYFSLYVQSTRMLAGAYIVIEDKDNAQRVFDMSVDKIKNIDFSKLKTIEYAHKGKSFEKIYKDTAAYLLSEKQVCMDDAKDYDCLSISLSGKDILEVIADGKTISKQETEQG